MVRKSLNIFLEHSQKEMVFFTDATKSKSFWDPVSKSRLKNHYHGKSFIPQNAIISVRTSFQTKGCQFVESFGA
jgi:hypothetical protein